MNIRCAVVDDHPVFRDGLARMLDTLEDVSVVAAGSTVAEAVDIANRAKPDVLLLDMRLPDGLGLNAVPDIRRVSPPTYVILLTGFADEDVVVDAFKAGVRGVIFKEADIDRIAEEIRTVAAGGVRLDTHLGARLVTELYRLNAEAAPALTERESQSSPCSPGPQQRRNRVRAEYPGEHGQVPSQPPVRKDRRARPLPGGPVRPPPGLLGQSRRVAASVTDRGLS